MFDQGEITRQMLRCSMRDLRDAAEYLAGAGRALDIAQDPIGIREDISTAYAAVATLALRIRQHLNLPDEPGCTRDE